MSRNVFNKYPITLQTRHAYSMLKRHGNGCFHVVSMWNTRGVFAGSFVVSNLCGNVLISEICSAMELFEKTVNV